MIALKKDAFSLQNWNARRHITNVVKKKRRVKSLSLLFGVNVIQILLVWPSSSSSLRNTY